MGSHAKVTNLTTGKRIKLSQAIGRVEQCVSAWVEPSQSIRDLSLAEMVAARSAQARLLEPLPLSELHGIVYRRPKHEAEIRQEAMIASAANRFVEETIRG